jgi:deferrochelatase/peroxidase EfeB
MPEFFESVPFETATEIEQLAKLGYELRENRQAVLQFHEVADEAALLQKIQAGAVAEHPAYEHYLAARILADTRETVRATLAERLKEANRT